MQNKPLSLIVPAPLLNQIRNITTARKNTNHPNRTQKSVIIELLETGLIFADDKPTPPHEDTTNTTQPQETKEVNNTLPMF